MIKMNGKPFKASRFAHNLRKDLYKEHLGLTGEDVIDPINDHFWWRFNFIAKVAWFSWSLRLTASHRGTLKSIGRCLRFTLMTQYPTLVKSKPLPRVRDWIYTMRKKKIYLGMSCSSL